MSKSVGWRVEFRSMEIQITAFENASFSNFVVLLTRTILYFDLNLYIPILRIDKKTEKAHARDAVLNKKFYFWKNPLPELLPVQPTHSQTLTSFSPIRPVEDEYELMRIDEIISGQEISPLGGYLGLVPLVKHYLGTCDDHLAARNKLDEYLELVESRANGTLYTAAK